MGRKFIVSTLVFAFAATAMAANTPRERARERAHGQGQAGKPVNSVVEGARRATGTEQGRDNSEAGLLVQEGVNNSKALGLDGASQKGFEDFVDNIGLKIKEGKSQAEARRLALVEVYGDAKLQELVAKYRQTEPNEQAARQKALDELEADFVKRCKG